MGLVDVMRQWETRYRLSVMERMTISRALSMRLNNVPLVNPELDPVLGAKVYAATYDALLERFRNEVDEPRSERMPAPPEGCVAPAWKHNPIDDEPEPEPLPPMTPTKRGGLRKAYCCSVCRQYGHRADRCPSR